MKLSVGESLCGYFMLSIYLLASPTTGFSVLENVRDVHDLCRDNRRTYEMIDDSSFQMVLQSNVPSSGNEKLLLHLKKPQKCTITFKVCSSCHISLVIRNMSIPSCSGNCSCNHFEIREPLSNYRSEEYCGEHNEKVIYFESKTKIVCLDFVQSVHEKFYVSLNFSVRRNVYLYTEDHVLSTRYIESPYFPVGYPSDYGAEHHFQASSPSSYVQLLFVDFQISQDSYVEVFGHNGTHVEVFTGSYFRPPVIVSQGPYLRLNFQANEQPSSHGFRCMFMFHVNNADYPTVKPQTNCGGKKDEYGGILTIDTPKFHDELYDCIWLIPPPLFSQSSMFLSASVLRFINIGPGSSLEFKQGLTSKGNDIKFYQCQAFMNCTSEIENFKVVAEAERGFYVRFRGYVGKNSSFLVTYHAFTKNNCSSSDFLCSDGNCIHSVLVCDTFKHCLDGSDEANCGGNTSSTLNGKLEKELQPSVTKQQVALDSQTGFFMFAFIGSSGLLTVFLLLAISMYHRYKNLRRIRLRSRRRCSRASTGVFSNIFASPAGDTVRAIDYPPSYEEFLTYSDRYPPLFYTRAKQRSSQTTSFDAEFFRPAGLSKESLLPNVPNASEIPVSVLPSLDGSLLIRVDYDTTSTKLQCVDLSVTPRLKRSVSLDLISRRSNYSVFHRQTPSSSPSSSSYCDKEDTLFNSLPSGFRVHSLQRNSSLSDFGNCIPVRDRPVNCSFPLSFPMCHSDIVLSIKRNCLPRPLRKRTYSF